MIDTDFVRVGVIGVGNMGSVHAKSIADGDVPGLKLAAIADRKPDRRDWAKQLLPPGVTVFDEGAELIHSDLIDAIIIAVPHYQHPELAIMGFENGLHVMVEKPAGVYTLAVREMNKAAEKSGGKTFGMMFNQRTNCLYRKMREMVNSGELGIMKRANWIITDWYRPQCYYDSGGWRATWAGEGGGVLANQCPHNLDLLQWICGLPSKVRAFCHNGKWHDIEVEDDVTAYLEFPGGATGSFITTTADAPGTNRFEITMEYGKLVCEHNKLTLWKLDVSEREFCLSATNGFASPPVTEIEVETDGLNEQHNGVLKAFAANILRGEPLVAPGGEGLNGLTLSNAMHLSSWLDKTIEIPFDEQLFLNELNKRRAASRHKTDAGIVFDTEGSY
ncbi:MAG: Gfo/Idh/MocA family oxidoreductase [Clostridiales bacterium]|nr:Gfo/Idh/MocA family oxidoreductase [Clostridiales bacterium]